MSLKYSFPPQAYNLCLTASTGRLRTLRHRREMTTNLAGEILEGNGSLHACSALDL